MDKYTKKIIAIALPILILVIVVALLIQIYSVLNKSIQNVFQPIEQANQQIATQVNQILNPTIRL